MYKYVWKFYSKPNGNFSWHACFILSLAQPNFSRVTWSYGLCSRGIIHFGAGTFSLCSTQTSSEAESVWAIRTSSSLLGTWYQWLKADKSLIRLKQRELDLTFPLSLLNFLGSSESLWSDQIQHVSRVDPQLKTKTCFIKVCKSNIERSEW